MKSILKLMCHFFFIRNNFRPQPKPRSSLVRNVNKEVESLPISSSHVNGSIVQRIKPFFEQTSSSSLSPPPTATVQETKSLKQQYQRQLISIPHTNDVKRISKATCLDDLISSNVCLS